MPASTTNLGTLRLLEAQPFVPPPVRLLPPASYDYVETGYTQLLSVPQDTQPHLRGVVQETLNHPGSLVRAQLAFGLMRGHSVDAPLARSIAVSIEYFHTASLLFDDLPCMDDAIERRGHACPHRMFGEDTAVLGALAFITRGYSLLWQGLSTLSPDQMARARRLVDGCLGVQGILNGQAYDLRFGDSARGEQEVLRVARGKTVTLIRLALLLPAIVCDVDADVCSRLERLADAWGLSYQIMDDFKDDLDGHVPTGKTSARDRALNHPNLPLAIGRERATLALREQMALADGIVDELLGVCPAWTSLTALHQLLAQQAMPFGVRDPARVAV